MNGWITIGSKLDTKELEKNVKEAEKRLREFEKKGQKLSEQKAKLEFDNSNLEKAIEEWDRMTEKASYYKKQLQEFSALDLEGKYSEEELVYRQGQAQKYRELLEEQNEIIAEQEGKYLKISDRLEKNQQNLKNINDLISSNKKNQEGLKVEVEETNQELSKTKYMDNMKKGADGVKNSMRDIVKQALRWGLAIFGIRSAYNFLRSSISTISQYNEQVATDIEYIRFALASTLEPVILRLIGLVKTLLNYINYIAQAWFGINLFAGASVDKFKSSKKELGGAAKQAKEINKQLAGFDEMNVLQDNTDTGGGGGASGGAMPSFDLSQFEGEIPDWLQWIVDHKDEILAIMAGVASGLLAWKLGLSAIQSLGLGVAIAGIVYAIMGLIEYLKDPSWENFGQIIQGIGVALVGLAIIIGSIPLAVAGAIVLIVGTIIKYWDEIKAFLQKGIDWLKDKSDFIHNVFGDTIGNIYDSIVNAIQNSLDSLDILFKGIKHIFDDIIALVKAIISGDWKKAWELAKDIIKTIFNTIVSIIKKAFDSVVGIVKSIGSAVGNMLWGLIKGAINGILGMVENVINAPIKMLNKAVGLINKIPGVNISKINTFSLPRLAKGGIINQPGRGVAIGGESGREGVIPLTDSQQMAMLGEAIGKYITINASITNTMNGRVISRELQRVQNENDFAFNR